MDCEDILQPEIKRSSSVNQNLIAMDEDPIEALTREVERKELRSQTIQQNLQHIITIPYCQPNIYEYMRTSEVCVLCVGLYSLMNLMCVGLWSLMNRFGLFCGV